MTHVSLVVRDQQEALDWYTQKMGWETRADDPFPGQDGGTHRWLTVAPPGQTDVEFVLEPLEWGLAGQGQSKEAALGTNGLVIGVDDCEGTVEELRARGVEIVDEPMEMPWGVSALVADLYGNTHNLVEAREG